MMIQISTGLLVQAYATKVQIDAQFFANPTPLKICLKGRARVESGWPFDHLKGFKTRAWLYMATLALFQDRAYLLH